MIFTNADGSLQNKPRLRMSQSIALIEVSAADVSSDGEPTHHLDSREGPIITETIPYPNLSHDDTRPSHHSAKARSRQAIDASSEASTIIMYHVGIPEATTHSPPTEDHNDQRQGHVTTDLGSFQAQKHGLERSLARIDKDVESLRSPVVEKEGLRINDARTNQQPQSPRLTKGQRRSRRVASQRVTGETSIFDVPDSPPKGLDVGVLSVSRPDRANVGRRSKAKHRARVRDALTSVYHC